jgi:hypothetical protein
MHWQRAKHAALSEQQHVRLARFHASAASHQQSDELRDSRILAIRSLATCSGFHTAEAPWVYAPNDPARCLLKFTRNVWAANVRTRPKDLEKRSMRCVAACSQDSNPFSIDALCQEQSAIPVRRLGLRSSTGVLPLMGRASLSYSSFYDRLGHVSATRISGSPALSAPRTRSAQMRACLST